MKKIYYGKSKFRRFVQSKGFYIALALCVVGAGTASYAAIHRNMQSLGDSNQSILQEQKKTEEKPVERGVSDLPKPSESSHAPQNAGSSEQESSVQQTDAKPSTPSEASQTQLYILPVAGEIIANFSGDTLVKNETLNVWRTHNGIDIKCQKGAPVKASNDGVVTKVYEDAVWGFTVEIEHADKVVSSYLGLDKDIKVKEKDVLKIGDAIGTVGEIPAEKTSEHLHFEMRQDGKFVDPMSLIKNANA